MKPQSLPHRLLVGTLSAMALLSATPTAVANPNAPIKILVGFAPGGGTDALARALADALQPVLKRTVIVENKPGGSGSIAAQSLKNSSPDGLSFMLVSDQFLITPMTLKAVGYGLGPVPAALMGMVTAIGGGMLRDVLVGRVPMVFSGELYATPALAGAAIAIGLDRLDQPFVVSAWAGGLVCLAWRLLALRRDWHAPMPRGPASV